MGLKSMSEWHNFSCQHNRNMLAGRKLFRKEYCELSQPTLVELLVEFALVSAVGGVFLEYVSVATAEFFQD